MDITQVRGQLTDFVKRLSQNIQVDEMIVFGSYATGIATPASDVDVLIISDDFNGVRSDRRFKILDIAARFIRPEIVAAGFTKEELNKAGQFSIVGQARDAGVRFL